MPLYHVRHETRYTYEVEVNGSYNEAILLPRDRAHQKVLSASLDIEPAPSESRESHDYFGNRRVFFRVAQKHSAFRVTADMRVMLEDRDRHDSSELLASKGSSWEDAVAHFDAGGHPEAVEAAEFRLDSPLVRHFPDLRDYARWSFQPGRPLIEAVHGLMFRIHRDFIFDAAFSTISTALDRVFQRRRGVCQDFAHLMIGCLRSQGLAARYVSGYIETLPPPGHPKLKGADHSHAWVSVHVPGRGWVDFDPTNGSLPDTQHITLGWGRDYGDVSPLKGVLFGGGAQNLDVSVDVTRIVAE